MARIVEVMETSDPSIKGGLIPNDDGTGTVFEMDNSISNNLKVNDDFHNRAAILLGNHRIMGCSKRNNNFPTLTTFSDAPLDLLFAQGIFLALCG